MYEGYAQFPATIRGGRVVLADDVELPDGTELVVVVKPLAFTAEEQAEFDGWEKLSVEADELIDRMIRESDRAAG